YSAIAATARAQLCMLAISGKPASLRMRDGAAPGSVYDHMTIGLCVSRPTQTRFARSRSYTSALRAETTTITESTRSDDPTMSASLLYPSCRTAWAVQSTGFCDVPYDGICASMRLRVS